MYQVDRQRAESLYVQIRRALEDEIERLYKPGDALPPEPELAERFSVNRHTLRRAVDELVQAGVLERRHGRGTFVLDAPVDYAVGRETRFTELLESLGKTTASRVIRKIVIPARGGVATRLALAEGAEVVWIETLRRVDERPFCVISHYLPRARVADALDGYAGGSLHAFLAERCGIRLRRTESVVSASLPLGDDASLLAMPQNRPVLRVKSVNVDDRDGRPVEYALTRFRADRVQLKVAL